MANDLNKVMLIGRLGREPESRTLPSGEPVCNFSIATGESWKNKETGDKVEKTEWHSISAFGPLAKICGEYLHKGSQVFIEGKLATRKWQDKDTGKDRYKTEIIAHQMQMLGGRPQSAESGQGSSASAAPRQQQRSQTPNQTGSGRGDDFDDDIPF